MGTTPLFPGPGTPPPTGRRRRRRSAPDAVRGRVKAHDPFDLIRWLAFSQPDPRKALAELVQNSLDAEARRVRIIRMRERGVACLKIHDDGLGVIPEMDRPKALEYIATHIGHSRKRSLSPQERFQLMTQGQYGIGLLGFWSLGHRLEMRTSVPGQRAHRLVLHRDDPHFEIEPLRGRLPLEERWTEVVVVGLHREAVGALVGGRAADYLASELRGQLLAREVEVVIEDRMARGKAQKLIAVRPPRFLGERIPGLDHVEVPGQPPIRLEVYFAGEGDNGGEPHGLAVYAAGTLVAEGFHQLSALGLDRPPWNDPRLTGLVDFPGLHVAPGSRRGVIVDEAGAAFASALESVEPVLATLLESLEQRRAEKLERTLVRDLQRAFRDFYRQRPRYAMLPVHTAKDEPTGPGEGDRGGAPGATADSTRAAEDATAAAAAGLVEDSVEPEITVSPIAPLLPPGPLFELRISPARVRVECGATKRLRAAAVDETGRLVEGPVQVSWHVEGPVGVLDEVETPTVEGRTEVVLTASEEPAEGTIIARARSADNEVAVEVPVEVLDELPNARPSEGVPEPEFVHQPGAPWRSRMQDGRWQVNSGHGDYAAVADRPPLKLRYLAMLFAKEIVLRSHQDPRLEAPLEQVVEVATFADASLAASRPGRRPRGAIRGAGKEAG